MNRSWAKRLILSLVLFASGSFVVGFVANYYLPRLESWLTYRLIQEVSSKSGHRLEIGSLHVGWLPPRLIFADIRLTPIGKLATELAPVEMERFEVKISWLSLLTGRVRLGEVTLFSPKVRYLFSASQKRSTAPDNFLQQMFEVLRVLPLDRLVISRLDLLLHHKSLNVATRSEDLDLEIENRGRALWLAIKSHKLQLKDLVNDRHMQIGIEARVYAETSQFRISALKVKVGESFVVASGGIKGDFMGGKIAESDLLARVQADLPDLHYWLTLLFPEQTIPHLTGLIRADLHLKAQSTSSVSLNADVNGKGLTIAGFVVGDIRGKISANPRALTASSLQIENSAGSARVEKLNLALAAPFPISAHVRVPSLEIRELLHNLKLKNLPLHIPLSGELPCQGQLGKPLNISCRGQVEASRVFVYDHEPQHPIVDVGPIAAQGEVEVDTKEVRYRANLSTKNGSRGRSDGVINYQTGFQISYQGDQVDIRDVKNLVNLKLEGQAAIQGTTNGTSKWGRAQMNVQARDLWLEDYALGNPEFELNYKEGTLAFRRLLGQIGNSRYSGNLSINIPRKEIFIQADSPFLEVADLARVFSRKVKIPLELSGSGAAKLKAWGPLAFHRLSYQLDSTIFRGGFGPETFDQLFFNVTAVDGHARANRVQLLKSQSVIDVTGEVHSTGKADLIAIGRQLRLEESESIGSLGLDLSGQVDFTMTARGQLPRPEFDMNGRISKLVIGDRPAEDSNFKLMLNGDRLSGQGRFLGDVLSTSFQVPLKAGLPLKLKIDAKDWNFANVFTVVSASARERQFESAVSGSLDVSSEDGSAKSLLGKIKAESFQIRRGPLDLRLKSPAEASIERGTFRAPPLIIEGSAGSLRFSAQDSSMTKLNLSATGKVDLAMAALMTPFLRDLQGRLTLNMQVSGEALKPLISGSAYVEQGFVRFRDFTPPFEAISADLLFSQQDIVINTLKASLGGGQVTGDGRIRLLGRGQIPVEVRGQVSGSNIPFPEGVRTKGSAIWSLKGPYFPYRLSLDYTIDEGEVLTDFGAKGLGTPKGLSTSALLPKFLVRPEAHPLEFDLNLTLRNPITVRNSNVQSLVRGGLKVVGQPDRLKMTGNLNPVPGGKVYFRDVEFEINSGYLEYQNDAPDDPKIYITAQTLFSEMIKDENDRDVENRYQIDLLVQGRGKNPKISLTSLPPLSERDIVSLLALGMTPQALENNRTAGQIARSNSVQIGTAVLQKPISREVKDRFGVDVKINQQASTTNDGADALKVTINRQFTPKLGASASRTIEKSPMSSAKMEYRFNRNLSIIGSWEGREQGTTLGEAETRTNQSIFGLDFEYRVNFK